MKIVARIEFTEQEKAVLSNAIEVLSKTHMFSQIGTDHFKFPTVEIDDSSKLISHDLDIIVNALKSLTQAKNIYITQTE